MIFPAPRPPHVLSSPLPFFSAPFPPQMTAICTDAENSLLYTADSRGRVLGWTLAGLVFTSHDFKGTGWETIRRVQSWRAHEMQVQSIDHILQAGKGYVLTASVDGLARMWTEAGVPIGAPGGRGAGDTPRHAADPPL